VAEQWRIKKTDRDKKVRPSQKLDPEVQQELDEALGDMNIEELLESGCQPAAGDRAVQTAGGEVIHTGKVLAIQGDDIFVEIGGKSQGILPAEQFVEEPLPKVGDRVEFTIERYDRREGLLILSRQGAVKAATWDNLQPGQLVEGRVAGHNKGGLELKISGIDAFMPVSQIELFHVDEMAGYLNQKLRCLVTEVDRREGKVVVSRRELLRQEAERKAEQLLESLEEGQTLPGVVRSIMPYGAFVDIGGLDGLLHVSDMSYARVEDPADIVKVGQEVQVVVLSVDRESRRISLGLKQAMADPWDDAEDRWQVDDIVAGRVVRLAPFGAFVELTEGVDGLIPASELSYDRRIRQPREILSEGQVVNARVMSVDSAGRRISLSLKRAGDDPWTGASIRWPVGSIAAGRVTRIADFGAFVELSEGVEGLIHISELADGYVRAAGEVVREGDELQAVVISVDEEARRISLSRKKLLESPDYTGQATEDEPAPRRPRKRPLKGGLD